MKAITDDWCWTLAILIMAPALATADPKRHFELQGGDATVMLNEFSRQSDIQVLFDFKLIKSVQTRAVSGDYDGRTALETMLEGTNLTYDFVNDHTLAVTPKRRLFSRLWHQPKPRLVQSPHALEEVVVISGSGSSARLAPGSRTLIADQADIDRSGAVTAADFLRTRPELFQGGPNESTSRGIEQASNSAQGVGANFRGLGAGASVALVNGHAIAPSGTDASWIDISNVPLSLVDHIEMIPEGGTARYGSEAVGGIINFVLRDHLDGAETQAHTGFAQGHTLGEQRFSQLWGTHSERLSTLLATEFYRRDALAAVDRGVTSDLRPRGGSNWDSPFGSPGTLIMGSQTWAIPQGQDGRSLSPSQLQAGTVSLHNTADGADILPSQQRLNLYSHTTLSISDNTHLLADLLWADRRMTKSITGEPSLFIVPTSNPYYINPTGDRSRPVQVMYGFLADLGPETLSTTVRTGNFTVQLKHVFDNGWNATAILGYTLERQRGKITNLVNPTALDIALADPNPATAFNPFGDGSHTNANTLAQMRAQAPIILNSTDWLTGVTAQRTLLSEAGGDITLTLGTDVHRQRLAKTFQSIGYDPDHDDQSRTVVASVGQLTLPIVGRANSLPGVSNLALSAAERIEHYSDVGTVSTPSYTATWSPITSLRLRTTQAWVFQAPSLGSLSEATAGSELSPVVDSRSATGQSIALLTFGGNHNLRPARGQSWSLGLDFSPLPELTLSLTHFNISLNGVVNSLPSIAGDVLGDPRFQSFVTQNPTPAERTDACHHGTFYGDLNGCLTSVVPIVHAQDMNISRIRTRGFDLAAQYTLSLGRNEYDFGLNATRTLIFSQAFGPNDSLVNVVNTDHNPLAMRARGFVELRRGPLTASISVNYAGRYLDTDSIPHRSIASWSTLDTQMSYDYPSSFRFALSVRNLGNSSPPFVNNSIGLSWDQENAVPIGRQIGFTVQKRF